MYAVIQRAARTNVDAEGATVGGTTGPELMVLLEVARDGGCEQVVTLARKIAELRTLESERSVMEAGAPILVVSQFTLYDDTGEGRRSPRSKATPSEQVGPLINVLVEDLRAHGPHIETGVFGTMMEVSLVNSGSFTVLVEARGVKTESRQRPEVNGDEN